MKNSVYIKRPDLENLECACCAPKDLISVNGIDMTVNRQLGLTISEGESYNLYLDITGGTPTHESYQYYFTEHEPITDELNEYFEFLSDGILSKNDFDILLQGKVGIFEYESAMGVNCYQIVGQAKGEYLVSNNIYFYIGKIEIQDGKFLVAYCESPLLCSELAI